MNPDRVLVTGGTRGLGLAICGDLMAAGYYVIAVGRTRTTGLSELIDEGVSDTGGMVVFEPLDLSCTSEIHGRVTQIIRSHGPIYGLVNNAAIAHEGVLATMHEREIHDVLNTNVEGTIVLTKYAVRPMLTSGRGRVINISSIIAKTGFTGLSVYAASKAALLGFTYSLARELGRAGITVNAVLPGYMETSMSSGLEEDKLATIVRRSPLGKLVRVDDVASAVRYLLSPAGQMITGTGMTIDGGSSC